MPVEGYPYSLEIMLEQLNAKGTLCSWQIYEEKQGTVCVRLRYECNGGSQSSVNTKEKISYKRKTKKQMTRDYQRAQRYGESGVKTRSRSKMDADIEMPRCDSDKLGSETINSSHIGQCDFGTPIQVEHSSPANHVTPVSPLIPDPNMSTTPDINKHDSEYHNSDHDHSDHEMKEQNLDDSGCNASLYQSEMNQPDKCDICGLACGLISKRCTHSDHKELFSVCNACHYKQSHDEHSNQLTHFILPPYAKYKCESCGIAFESKIDKVIKCTKCQNYLLCEHCFKSSKHKGHAFFMETSLIG